MLIYVPKIYFSVGVGIWSFDEYSFFTHRAFYSCFEALTAFAFVRTFHVFRG